MKFPRPVVLLLALLHVYIGVRLLLPFGAVTQLAGGALLAVCFWLLPKGFRIRDDRGAWAVMLPWLTMGFFSWLLVLTLARDASLIASALALSPQVHEDWIRISAIGVMALTPARPGSASNETFTSSSCASDPSGNAGLLLELIPSEQGKT